MSDTGPGGIAVSLAYVGTWPEHAEIAADLADRNYLATFFLTPERVLEHPVRWRHALSLGHDVGCDSLYGVTENGRLPNWTRATVEADLFDAHKFMLDQFPLHTIRTGIAPGSHCEASDGEYLSILQRTFPFVCVPRLECNQAQTVDLSTIAMLPPDRHDLAFRWLAEPPKDPKTIPWIVLSFDRLRGSDREAHDDLLARLRDLGDRVWVASVSEVGTRIRVGKGSNWRLH